ncbi:hypothetical protein B0H67DRAFT_583552 [Lasiosphaeris hirsuta]|uniref:Carcinoembryonic antigen-related cell adhesion molecule 1 n=1 Tax=Lasiosphaeris hirsuta TaxID=260670 RepID=A0AA40DRL6_9PEZI|nr:hypothetical protein B0H67DRAFT_583552 [Lasiosphaeris hirsuta]
MAAIARRMLLIAALFSTTEAAAWRVFPRDDADWMPPAQTATATTTDGSDPWTHLRVSHRPTDAPRLDLRATTASIGVETCGFFPEDDRAMSCPPGITCTNIGNYRDCCVGADCTTSSFASVCLNFDDPSCGTHNQGTSCCNQDANLPYCGTYIWSTSITPNQVFTLFQCDNKIFSGVAILYPEPHGVVTVTDVSTTPASTSSASSASSTATHAAADSGGSSTPVGGIVGGVIGGLAVIGFVVLGIFYMFFYSRRGQRGAYAAAAKGEPDGSNGHDATPTSTQAPFPPTYNPTAYGGAPPHAYAPSPAISPDSTMPPLGNTPRNVPHHAMGPEIEILKAGGLVEVSTSPMSKEMPTSPSSREMPTSPLSKEMPTSPLSKELSTSPRATELPISQYRSELPA